MPFALGEIPHGWFSIAQKELNTTQRCKDCWNYDKMKTIKELEAEIGHNSMVQRGLECYNKSVRVQALKDVVKLIDEMHRKFAFGKAQSTIGWNNALKELKARIKG